MFSDRISLFLFCSAVIWFRSCRFREFNLFLDLESWILFLDSCNYVLVLLSDSSTLSLPTWQSQLPQAHRELQGDHVPEDEEGQSTHKQEGQGC